MKTPVEKPTTAALQAEIQKLKMQLRDAEHSTAAYLSLWTKEQHFSAALRTALKDVIKALGSSQRVAEIFEKANSEVPF